MRYFKYIEPDTNFNPIEVIISEEEIISQYYGYWALQMIKVNKIQELSWGRCVEDFCVVHWATEAKHDCS